jgi:predicted amidohydrolase YtcJ
VPLILALAAAAPAGCSKTEKSMADVIITNARVWTVDKAHPSAEAIAIAGDRIVAVGTRSEIESRRGASTRTIDAGGRLVLPGFNDSHIHFMTGALQLTNVDLKDAPSPEEFARRIGERANAAPADWVVGGNWDEQAWTPARLPTKELIDGVTPNTPVFVSRYDEHMALANSVALKLAGVTAKTPDPPGGTIVRDAKGNPTGVLKDAAMGQVDKVIPPLTPEQEMRATRLALQHMAQLGITSVQAMSVAYPHGELDTWSRLAVAGELTVRIYAVPLETAWLERARKGTATRFDHPFLTVVAVKGFADGSLGSTTAYFFQPYTDAPGATGLLADEMQPLDGMRARLTEIDRAGKQLCIHAIGDRAISMVLDLFSDVARANGPRDRRFRIEHAQHVAPADFDRFASLEVIASVQPYHAIDDGRWAEKRIGPERAKTTYPFRSFLDHRVRLAIGTDWPVAPLNPMLGLYAAATRATLDGQRPGGWVPEQKITVAEAIEGYTLGAAYAQFAEKEKGSITPGKLADLVMLSDDVLRIDPAAIKDVKVQMTMVGGKVVYQK